MLASYIGAVEHPRSTLAYFRRGAGRMICANDAEYAPTPSDCIYRFSDRGYHSEEFRGDAKLKVFVCGCSYTFAMGVAEEDIWPSHVKNRIAAAICLDPGAINLQNFSQIGASNTYIARTIVQQCDKVRPDLAIVAFTHRERAEYLASGLIRNIGVWNLRAPKTGWKLWQRPVDGDAALLPGFRYFDQYNDASGSLDLLKNMMLVQFALRRRGIPYLFTMVDPRILDVPPISCVPQLHALAQMIDRSHLVDASIIDPDIRVDSIEEHPGPKSHERFAGRVFDAISRRVLTQVVERTSGRSRRSDEPDAAHTATTGGAGTRIIAVGDWSRASIEALLHGRMAENAGSSCHGSADISLVGLGANDSNDRVVRTVLASCGEAAPAMVLAAFTSNPVHEHFAKEELVELSPASAGRSPPARVAKLAESFFEYLTNELQQLYNLRNVLLLQEYLKMMNIEYLLKVPRDCDVFWPSGERHPVIQAMALLIDRSHLVECGDAHPRQQSPGVCGDTHKLARRTGKQRSLIYTIKRIKRQIFADKDKDNNIYPLW